MGLFFCKKMLHVTELYYLCGVVWCNCASDIAHDPQSNRLNKAVIFFVKIYTYPIARNKNCITFVVLKVL